MQQPFDPKRLQVTGEATPVIEQVLYNPALVAPTSRFRPTACWRSVGHQSQNQFAWFDRTGKLIETVGPPGNYRTPDLSPDGRFLAYGDVKLRESGFSTWRENIPSGFTSGPAMRRRRCGFRTGARSRIARPGWMFEKDVTGTGPSGPLQKKTSTAQPYLGGWQVDSLLQGHA